MPQGTLTSRQKQVLDRLQKGEKPAQIAKALKMSTNGVYQHRRRLEERGFLAKDARNAAGNGNGRSKAHAVDGKTEMPSNGFVDGIMPSNGLLADTAKVLDERVSVIEGALTKNGAEAAHARERMDEYERYLGGLEAERENLAATEAALNEARAKITA